jgi:hypothetical protein
MTELNQMKKNRKGRNNRLQSTANGEGKQPSTASKGGRKSVTSHRHLNRKIRTRTRKHVKIKDDFE